jgi:hypothetical protein
VTATASFKGARLRCPICGNKAQVLINVMYPPVCNNPSHKPQPMEVEEDNADQ